MRADHGGANSLVRAPNFKEKFTGLCVDKSHDTILTENSKNLSVERSKLKSQTTHARRYGHASVHVFL